MTRFSLPPANDVPPDALDDGGAPLPISLAAILAVIGLGGITDLALDKPATWLSLHVLFEVVMVVASATGAAVLWRRWRRAEQSAGTLRTTMESHRAERDAWRLSAQSALDGLGRAINERFSAWELTPTEREVALLLLKGESHKRIASFTNRSERTVRQHAVAVYNKSGLHGRAELAAFFLQDLLLPADERAQ